MATGKVDICGIDTSSLPLIRGEEAREMLEQAQKGDLEARRGFIQGNLRLVLSVIQRFQGRGECVDDLFQVGCIGLIKAIDHFDLSQNVRFSTYAVPIGVCCRKKRSGIIHGRTATFRRRPAHFMDSSFVVSQGKKSRSQEGVRSASSLPREFARRNARKASGRLTLARSLLEDRTAGVRPVCARTPECRAPHRVR